ncbi:hypothetical protein [Devosia ginsengisoli]|uniref:hypothetical protein n=1 Tax=Devosia ginsengisoli TaxID=400770 RepID=UPI001644893E|nr:hypothetical protein [Devosia ginsengisoli]
MVRVLNLDCRKTRPMLRITESRRSSGEPCLPIHPSSVDSVAKLAAPVFDFDFKFKNS